jgi:VanZ family protein
MGRGVSAMGDEGVSVPLADARRAKLSAVVAAWGPVVVWVAVIFSLSSDQFSDVNTAAWLSAMPMVGILGIPPAAIEAGNFIVRKSAHFVEYALLGMLLLRALRATSQQRGRRALAVAIAGAAVCASLDELRQHFFTATRTGTAHDVVLDIVGALIGALVGATYLYRRVARR